MPMICVSSQCSQISPFALQESGDLLLSQLQERIAQSCTACLKKCVIGKLKQLHLRVRIQTFRLQAC